MVPVFRKFDFLGNKLVAKSTCTLKRAQPNTRPASNYKVEILINKTQGTTPNCTTRILFIGFFNNEVFDLLFGISLACKYIRVIRYYNESR